MSTTGHVAVKQIKSPQLASEADGWNAVVHSAMHLAIAAIRKAGPNSSQDAVRVELAKTKAVPVVMGLPLWLTTLIAMAVSAVFSVLSDRFGFQLLRKVRHNVLEIS